MNNRVLAAVRLVAPAVLAVGTFLASAPAYAGAIPEKLPSPTPASHALKAKAATGMRTYHQLQRSMKSGMRSNAFHMHHR